MWVVGGLDFVLNVMGRQKIIQEWIMFFVLKMMFMRLCVDIYIYFEVRFGDFLGL